MKAKGIEKVCVTGGAGFIGSHTVDLLINHGYHVSILDNLEPQVHGEADKAPSYVNKDAAFIHGDIRDSEIVKKIVQENDAIIHLAAMVGIGQSMYQVKRYIDTNTEGTANLLDILVNNENNVRKAIVASSMSVYGEGRYYCEKCSTNSFPNLRDEKQFQSHLEPLCPMCNSALISLPTDEEKPLMPTSIYAMTKRHQEEMALLVGKTYGVPSIALRFFNVYGSRQSLKNPYTGVTAIFLSRLLNKKPPYVFEDGNQTRDFIHVKDAAQAVLLALEKGTADYTSVNVGTGKATSIVEVAEMLARLLNLDIKPIISGKFRKGDIRHCFADISKAQRLLGYQSKIGIEEGFRELVAWARGHHWEAIDLFDNAVRELEEKNLT